MGFTPMLAQIDLPYEQMLQAQLGTLALVLGIILVLSIGAGAAIVAVPLLKLLNRLTDVAQTAQAEAKAATAQTLAVQTTLNSAALSLTDSNTAQTRAVHEMHAELKTQTTVLTGMSDGFRATVQGVSDGAVKLVTDRLDAHDGVAREGMARIEASIASLRAEFSAGHKAQRAEVVGKLDQILAEIEALKTPPAPTLEITQETRIETDGAAEKPT